MSAPPESIRSDQSDMKNSSSTSFSSVLDGFIRMSTLAFAVAYASGVVVVSIHLANYGIVDLDLVRTQYILVGFLALLYILCPLALYFILAATFDMFLIFDWKRFTDDLSNIVAFIGIVIICFAGIFSVVLSLPGKPSPTFIFSLWSYMYLEDGRWIMTTMLILMSAVTSFRMGLLKHTAESHNVYGFLKLKLSLYTKIPLVFALLVFCLVIYASKIHPLTKSSFGGGIPRRAILTVRPEELPTSLFYSSDSLLTRSMHVLLIHENREEIYFLLPHSQIDSLGNQRVFRMIKSQLQLLELVPTKNTEGEAQVNTKTLWP